MASLLLYRESRELVDQCGVSHCNSSSKLYLLLNCLLLSGSTPDSHIGTFNKYPEYAADV